MKVTGEGEAVDGGGEGLDGVELEGDVPEHEVDSGRVPRQESARLIIFRRSFASTRSASTRAWRPADRAGGGGIRGGVDKSRRKRIAGGRGWPAGGAGTSGSACGWEGVAGDMEAPVLCKVRRRETIVRRNRGF